MVKKKTDKKQNNSSHTWQIPRDMLGVGVWWNGTSSLLMKGGIATGSTEVTLGTLTEDGCLPEPCFK